VDARQVSELFKRGENIATYLRASTDMSNQEIIELSYDAQTGSYIEMLSEPAYAAFMQAYTAEIVDRVLALQPGARTLMEAGVGECTTLAWVWKKLLERGQPVQMFGVDVSWSRLAQGQSWVAEQGLEPANLAVADLLDIPLPDNCIDVVYTSHSIEPNRGQEKDILAELYRITRSFLILLEPGYELATAPQRARMDRMGYCRGLVSAAESLGLVVLSHELFPHTHNSENPTAMTVIRKEDSSDEVAPVWCCPRSKWPLEWYEGALFSQESLTAYPILGGIPCLRPRQGIAASRLPAFVQSGFDNCRG
jgi:uncharacterized protein YbaR (Trm112 family)